MNIPAVIEKIFLFDGTNAAAICEKYSLESECTFRTYLTGDTIVSPTSSPGAMIVIVSGKAKILSNSENGTLLRLAGAGDCIGALKLFCSDELYKTCVIAKTQCRALLIPKSVIQRIIENESAAAMNMIRFLADRIDFLNRRITSFTAQSAEEKLCVYLSQLEPTGGEITLPVSCSALSDMLSIGRASLYRAFDKLERDGRIIRRGRKITINNLL